MRWLADRLAPGQPSGPGGPGRQLLAPAPPAIGRHWEAVHVAPLLQELGSPDAASFFCHWLLDSVRRTGSAAPRLLSLGAGDGQVELGVARAFAAAGVTAFTIECVEPHPLLRARLRALALAQGLDRHLIGIAADCNDWRRPHRYDGILANGSLHRVVRLERLLDAVRHALADGAWFVTRARIGRNGHRRWPEALAEVAQLWPELPPSHRWNHVLRRHEERFTDWDSGRVGDDGVRAQDVLPELLRRFTAPVFAGFGNLIDVFTSAAFGPNFAPGNAWDRAFVAHVHARDEALLRDGALQPTHMVAVWSRDHEPVRAHARGLAPARCVRRE